jgi:hypothetical protein
MDGKRKGRRQEEIKEERFRKVLLLTFTEGEEEGKEEEDGDGDNSKEEEEVEEEMGRRTTEADEVSDDEKE